jgi:hypothetical protein
MPRKVMPINDDCTISSLENWLKQSSITIEDYLESLIIAIRCGNQEVVARFLHIPEVVANIAAKDNFLLHTAATSSCPKIVSDLLAFSEVRKKMQEGDQIFKTFDTVVESNKHYPERQGIKTSFHLLGNSRVLEHVINGALKNPNYEIHLINFISDYLKGFTNPPSGFIGTKSDVAVFNAIVAYLKLDGAYLIPKLIICRPNNPLLTSIANKSDLHIFKVPINSSPEYNALPSHDKLLTQADIIKYEESLQIAYDEMLRKLKDLKVSSAIISKTEDYIENITNITKAYLCMHQLDGPYNIKKELNQLHLEHAEKYFSKSHVAWRILADIILTALFPLGLTVAVVNYYRGEGFGLFLFGRINPIKQLAKELSKPPEPSLPSP